MGQERDNLFCASLRRRNAHGHMTRAIFIRELKGKHAAPQERDNLFVQGCTVEKHIGISQVQEPLSAIISRKQSFCASLRASLRTPHAHDMDISDEHFHAGLKRNVASRLRLEIFAGLRTRKCFEMQMNIAQERIDENFQPENQGSERYPDFPPVLTPTVRTTQWTHCLGKHHVVCQYLEGDGSNKSFDMTCASKKIS